MLAEYKDGVEALAAASLDPYTAWITEQYHDRHASAKEINDPVWGTLTLSALEVLLLDSPLLQRLRSVRQLGVAHWVYPSATHTRLEHSVGALFLAQRLLGAAELGDAPPPPSYARAVRVAALCHDVGHGVMSHVSENALAYIESSEELRLEFTDEYRHEAQLGEINSFLLVGSPAFASLLAAAEGASREMVGIPNATAFIQKCIIGEPVDPKHPLLHQLVSGPFDADKLDYMTRDAYMSGVPVVTDVNRLIRKVRSIRIPRIKAPLPVQRLSDTEIDEVCVIGIDRSGNRTLDELTLGRTLLFDKLYRHHKTRACEAMVTGMLVRIAEAAVAAGRPWEASLVALRLDDRTLLSGDVSRCLQGFELDDEGTAVVQHLAGCLRERRLFVRSVAFSRKMTSDPYDQDDEQARGLQELLAYIEDPIHRREVADEIAELADGALDALGVRNAVEKWPGSLRNYVWLDGVRSAEHLSASTKAMLITPEGDVVPFAAEAPETPQWATAYQQTRDTAFVFCPVELALPVAFATERFVRERYGVRLPRPALVALRRSPTAGRSERTKLASAGYYDGSPVDLRPIPERLRQGDADTLIADIASRLNGYCPPLVSPGRAGRDRFDPGRVRDFVQQFESDELIDTALQVLGEIEILDRHDVVRPLSEFLEGNDDFHDASLVVFGSGGDSSSIATYFGMDVGARYPLIRTRDLGEALMVEKPILFVDDIIGSGRQGSSIVRAWFGDTALADELGEERRVLPAQGAALLQSARVAFCFAAGLDGGADELRNAFRENGAAEPRIKIGREEHTLPTLYSAGAVGAPERERFVSRCSAIGDELLEGQPPEKRLSRRLGYGDKGLLVAFPYNTPSQALTCLWERGEVEGRPWTPLLPRRRKR